MDVRPGQIWRSPDGAQHVFVLDVCEGWNVTRNQPSTCATVYPVALADGGWVPVADAVADELFTDSRREGWLLYDHADLWMTDGPCKLVSISPNRYYDLPRK